MALKQYSAFTYGHTITASNKFINFIEPTYDNVELTVELQIGSYSLTKFLTVLGTALNSIGNQEYTIGLNRETGQISISSTDNFSLLVNSGSNSSNSAYPICGFKANIDLTGANSYESDSRSGSIYITQSPLFNYSRFIDNKEKTNASVKQTATGITEVVSFATLERMKCNLPLITNFVPQNFIRETATGIEEARDFMDYAITKAPLEFYESINDFNTFDICILDLTGQSRNGVGFELQERIRDGLAGYYQLNGLQFLKIEG